MSIEIVETLLRYTTDTLATGFHNGKRTTLASPVKDRVMNTHACFSKTALITNNLVVTTRLELEFTGRYGDSLPWFHQLAVIPDVLT